MTAEMSEIEVDGKLVSVRGETCRVDFWYPRNEGNAKFVEVGLSDVRAADSIRIHYDFERDGYVIEQAAIFEWPADDEEMDRGWQEVAFVQAWALEKNNDER